MFDHPMKTGEACVSILKLTNLEIEESLQKKEFQVIRALCMIVLLYLKTSFKVIMFIGSFKISFMDLSTIQSCPWNLKV